MGTPLPTPYQMMMLHNFLAVHGHSTTHNNTWWLLLNRVADTDPTWVADVRTEMVLHPSARDPILQFLKEQ